MGNLSKLVAEATIGDHIEKLKQDKIVKPWKKFGQDQVDIANNRIQKGKNFYDSAIHHKIKDFDIDRHRLGKSAYPTVRDHIREKIEDHPKVAMAAGAASAIGAGYGAYKYLKHRKDKKENKKNKE